MPGSASHCSYAATRRGQRGVADQARVQVVGLRPGALGDEARHDVAPAGIHQRRVGLQRRDVQDQLHPVAMQRHELGVERVEVDDGGAQRVHPRLAGVGDLEGVGEVLQAGVEVAPDDVVLRGEVAEERPPADAGRGGDVLDGGLVEAALGEQRERHPLDLQPRGHRRPTGAALGAR